MSRPVAEAAQASSPPASDRRSLGQRWAAYKAQRFPLARKRIPWVIAAGLAIFVFSEHFALGWVWTESVPANVVIVLKGTPPVPGQLMAYVYEGAAIGGWKRGDAFIKYAAAMEGDIIHRDGRQFWAETPRGRVPLGLAKQFSAKGVPLAPADAGVVPAGFIYAHAPHADALDSRYAVSGLVSRRAVIGRAVVLF